MMHSKRIHIGELQREFIHQHRNADSVLTDERGNIIRTIYHAPLEQWKGLIAPDGTVLVPDMDYYNSLKEEATIVKALEEDILPWLSTERREQEL